MIRTVRRHPVSGAALAAAPLLAAALAVAPMAVAAPDSGTPDAGTPGTADPCSASEISKTMSAVSLDTGNYLDANPDTNRALTAIAAKPGDPRAVAAVQAYFEKNPRAGRDLQLIQQPLSALSSKCGMPIAMPQMLGLVQAAQQPGAMTPPSLTQVGSTPATPGLSIVPVVTPPVPAATPPAPVATPRVPAATPPVPAATPLVPVGRPQSPAMIAR